jgi:plastocyanin
MRNPIRTVAALLVLTAALALGACSSSDAASTTTTAPTAGAVKPSNGGDLPAADFVDSTGQANVTVQVRDNTFNAPYVEVDAGTTITFTNKGHNTHDVYPVVDGEFTPIEVAELEPGESATLTLDEAGDVAYYCTLHGTTTKGMVGGIRVG